MKILDLSVDSIHFDPANARKHPDRNLDAIKASLARFGQQTPIVVDGKNIVRKGNGTLAAAKALGWSSVKAVRSDLPNVDMTAYAIADNRTSELAEWDGAVLAETLRALQSEEDFDLDSVGFTEDEIGKLCEGLGDELAGDCELPEPGEPAYKEQYGVIVICKSEADQQAAFEKLEGLGYECRVVAT